MTLNKLFAEQEITCQICKTRKSAQQMMHSDRKLIAPNSDQGEPGEWISYHECCRLTSLYHGYSCCSACGTKSIEPTTTVFANSNHGKSETGIFSHALNTTKAFADGEDCLLVFSVYMNRTSHIVVNRIMPTMYSRWVMDILTAFQSDNWLLIIFEC